MAKLLFKILVFLLLFFVVARVVGTRDNIDRAVSINPNIIRIANAGLFDSLDILFAGSSASYSGVMPAYFDSIGLRTYNLSVAAAGPYFYKLLVDDYINSVHQKPKSVFLLFIPSTFMHSADDFTEIGVHRYLNTPVSNETIAGRYHLWASYPRLVIKSFQKGMKNTIHIEQARKEAIEQTVRDKGFLSSGEVTSSEKERNERLAYAGFIHDSFDQAKFLYLERYADSLQKAGMRVAFFTVPGNKMRSFYNSDFMRSFEAAKSSLQQKFAFLDAGALPLDSSAFRNSDHLNTKGAILVTRKIIADMMADEKIRNWYGIPRRETQPR